MKNVKEAIKTYKSSIIFTVTAITLSVLGIIIAINIHKNNATEKSETTETVENNITQTEPYTRTDAVSESNSIYEQSINREQSLQMQKEIIDSSKQKISRYKKMYDKIKDQLNSEQQDKMERILADIYNISNTLDNIHLSEDTVNFESIMDDCSKIEMDADTLWLNAIFEIDTQNSTDIQSQLKDIEYNIIMDEIQQKYNTETLESELFTETETENENETETENENENSSVEIPTEEN